MIKRSWDEAARVIASIRTRIVSPSLILHRLGTYARLNGIHQALAEIGRVYKTIWILRYLDDEPLRRRAGRELNHFDLTSFKRVSLPEGSTEA